MKTIEQKRGDILAKRLQQLNDFLLSGTKDTLADFLSKRGISAEEFSKGLPDFLKNKTIQQLTIENDKDYIVDYTNKLNDEYVKQYLAFEKSNISADGDENCDGNKDCGGCPLSADGDEFLYAKGKYVKKKEKQAEEHGCKEGEKWSVPRKKCVKKGGVLNAANKFNPAMTVVRKSSLSIISLNLFGVASALQMLKEKDPVKWKKFLSVWFKLGGTEKRINKSVDRGKKKKMFPKLKKKKSADGVDEYYWSIEGNYKQADGEDEEETLTVQEGDKESPPIDAGKLAAVAAAGLGAASAILAVSPPPAQAAAVWVGASTPVVGALVPILKSLATEKGEDTSKIPDVPPPPPDLEPDEKDDVDDETKDKGKDKKDDIKGYLSKYKWYLAGGLGVVLALATVLLLAGKKK